MSGTVVVTEFWRVGRRADPLRVLAEYQGAGRFDDPERLIAVLYGAPTLRTCLLEFLLPWKAAPGAGAVLGTIPEPTDEEEAGDAARDRALTIESRRVPPMLYDPPTPNWSPYGCTRKSPHTVRAYGDDVAAFRRFTGKPLRATSLSDLQRYADSLVGAPATRGRRLKTLKSLLSFATRMGYLPFNAGAAIHGPALEQKLAERILSERQVFALPATNGSLRMFSFSMTWPARRPPKSWTSRGTAIPSPCAATRAASCCTIRCCPSCSSLEERSAPQKMGPHSHPLSAVLATSLRQSHPLRTSVASSPRSHTDDDGRWLVLSGRIWHNGNPAGSHHTARLTRLMAAPKMAPAPAPDFSWSPQSSKMPPEMSKSGGILLLVG